jgi:isopenicillin N synthase-like dioxygenase
MSYPTARAIPISALPLIDIAKLKSTKLSDREVVAQQIRQACLDKGFFYIANHDVPAPLVDAVFRESRSFFALPLADRMSVRRSRSACNRGFEPMGGQDLERTGFPDLKEAYDLGVEQVEADHVVRLQYANIGLNQWPSGAPLFRRVMEAYFEAMLALAIRLMGALALSLGLAENYFDGFCAQSVALLRLLHYPQQPVKPYAGEKGCGAHTDWGAITVLLQDDAGGLQINDPAHGWLHAPPRTGSFVVNLGDIVARWTNDRYRSTEHRVINLSGRDRYSVPFFFDGNPDHLISCLPGCSGPNDPPKYAPVTVAAHTDAMHRLAAVTTPAERSANG